MSFSPNPLSLSVPDGAFDSWLRDSGYLEIIDQRTSDVHRHSSAAAAAAAPITSTSAPTTPLATGFFISLFSRIVTLLSIFTLNPFAKLSAADFSGPTPSWTSGFIGSFESYSFPSSPAQARLRAHENAKRYARNYASLFVLFFVCTLYQMPVALLGLISCMALWDVVKFCCNRWGLDKYPVVWQCLVRVAQCVTVIILLFSNFQMAIFCALGIGYTGMILHAAFRKLTLAKPPSTGSRK
ncbi:PRA1 family protein H-like isoform X1 [Cucurbita moschata]|uniref:PRA1 family protein n=1 Tax=Cucurbita moschata TaxID=3662 RepID=A0A6J1FMA4_CUCMO|nr:PRA1 family protein H-like isoform X1 [Cucurbita moschata]